MTKHKFDNVATELSKSKSPTTTGKKKRQSLAEDYHSKKSASTFSPKNSSNDKYKVGDIAALFTKPKSPSSTAGKKLQSLFEDYYSKKSNTVLFDEKEHKLTTDEKAVELNDKNSLKKGKKRKFDSSDDSRVGENKKFKKEQDFPRKKNNDSELNKNDFSPMFIESSQQKDGSVVNKNKNFKKWKKQQDFPWKNNKVSKIEGNRSPLKFEEQPGGENGPKTDKKRKAKKLKKQQDSLIQNNQSGISSSNNSTTAPKLEVKNISEEFPSVSKLKNMKKDSKLKGSFIKKSKKQSLDNNHNKLTNTTFFQDSSDKDDAVLRKELQEFMNDNSLKEKLEENDANTGQDSKRNQKKKLSVIKQGKSYYQDEKSKKKKHKHNNEQQDSFGNEKAASISPNFANKKPKNKYDSGKQNSPLKNQDSVKKFKHEMNTNNDNFVISENNPEMKNSQAVDFVRKPKNKNVENSTLGKDYFKKSSTEAFNNNFASKKFKNKEFNNAKEQSQIMKFESDAPDFIKLPRSHEENNEDSFQERLSRTLFVGNLPKTTRKQEVKNLFSTFGKVEHVRLTGIETDKAKIFAKNSPKLLHANYASDTIPGFVVFKDKQSAVQALCLSGSVFKGHHITVDFALPAGSHKIYDEKRTIFIGNLPFDVKDESVWNAFNQCGKVEGVRVVRDRETGLGKGFGYVLFSTVEAKQNALGLENLSIEGRDIRIKAVNSNQTQKANSSFVKRDTFKSRAIRLKNNAKVTSGRKSIRKLTNKQKMLHKKKKIASILQKAMK